MPKPKLIEVLEGGRERAVVRSATGNVYLVEDISGNEQHHSLLATSVVGCRTLALALLALSDRMARGE